MFVRILKHRSPYIADTHFLTQQVDVDVLKGKYCDEDNPVATITVIERESHLTKIELKSP